MLRRGLPQPLYLRRICLSANSRHISPGLTPVQRFYSTERPPQEAAARPSDLESKETPASSSSTPTSSLESGSPSEAYTDPARSFSAPRHPDDPPASSEALLSRLRARAQEWSTQAAITARHKTDDTLASLAVNLRKAGGEINRATGYNEIDALKRRVSEQEARMSATRAAAREAKEAFESAVRRRSASQKEVNDLLQRKSTWSEADVGRFTELVRADHSTEQEEARAKTAAEAAEEAVEREFSLFMRAILDRYHEEQVWSDKIRSVSSYGSLAAIGINVLVFITAILFVEPWKRKRLAQTFERKVEELEREHRATVETAMGRLEDKLSEQDVLIAQLVALGAAAQATHHEPLAQPAIPLPVEADDSTAKVDMQKLVMALNMAVIATTAVLGAFTLIAR
ncbi:hypothetical protein PENSPDRAFT_615468 [Peniophora sp. CONT]|nr:hypothetical protein PENSPDRAFT_615468 [Peniophora sp. CONT]